MTDPLVPSVGWGVLHLFCKLPDAHHPDAAPRCDTEAVVQAVKDARADDVQVVTVAMLGHKADLGVMALGADLWRLRRLQSDLQAAGLVVVDSYVSLTEVSEYAAGVPDDMKQMRLYPQLPPEGKTAFCFYPMSKRRGDTEGANWFTLPFEERKEMMYGHGSAGRKFAGRIVQVITGSTGIDDWEWGVTLFAVHPDDLKECVYTMRFDEGSARFAEFGPFLTGMVAPVEDVLAHLVPRGVSDAVTDLAAPPAERRAGDPPVGTVTEVDARPPADIEALRSELRSLGSVVVAFSGGADSAFVARVATDTLGADRVLCVTAVSPSLAPEELEDCRALAAEWGLRHLEVATDELADPSYAANDGSRCYHCKASLMAALDPVSDAAGPAATVVLGVNLDDLADHRPGQTAAAERGAVFPLVAAGFTKADVRAWSRRLGLRTWDKPAAACLASRVPYGTRVTITTLDAVARAESGLRALGFRRLRVRHYGDTARIEVPTDELAGVVEARRAVCDAVHGAGYRYVTLDLDGFRSGNLNHSLTTTEASP